MLKFTDSMRFSIIVLLAVLTLNDVQAQSGLSLEEINPYKHYLSTIKWSVAHPKNDLILAEIISILRLTYPGISSFELLAHQETAGSDPIFLREFTKRQIERHGNDGAKLAVSVAFGLSKSVTIEIFNGEHFKEFLTTKSKEEIEREETKLKRDLLKKRRDQQERELSIKDGSGIFWISELTNAEDIEVVIEDTLIHIIAEKISQFEEKLPDTYFSAFYEFKGDMQRIEHYNLNVNHTEHPLAKFKCIFDTSLYLTDVIWEYKDSKIFDVMKDFEPYIKLGKLPMMAINDIEYPVKTEVELNYVEFYKNAIVTQEEIVLVVDKYDNREFKKIPDGCEQKCLSDILRLDTLTTLSKGKYLISYEKKVVPTRLIYTSFNNRQTFIEDFRTSISLKEIN